MMTDDCGELPAALDSRLPSTWKTPRRSAITRGRPGATSMGRFFLLPALAKPLSALPTSTAT